MIDMDEVELFANDLVQFVMTLNNTGQNRLPELLNLQDVKRLFTLRHCDIIFIYWQAMSWDIRDRFRQSIGTAHLDDPLFIMIIDDIYSSYCQWFLPYSEARFLHMCTHIAHYAFIAENEYGLENARYRAMHLIQVAKYATILCKVIEKDTKYPI